MRKFTREFFVSSFVHVVLLTSILSQQVAFANVSTLDIVNEQSKSFEQDVHVEILSIDELEDESPEANTPTKRELRAKKKIKRILRKAFKMVDAQVAREVAKYGDEATQEMFRLAGESFKISIQKSVDEDLEMTKSAVKTLKKVRKDYSKSLCTLKRVGYMAAIGSIALVGGVGATLGLFIGFAWIGAGGLLLIGASALDIAIMTESLSFLIDKMPSAGSPEYGFHENTFFGCR
jgi:hypothetical protein